VRDLTAMNPSRIMMALVALALLAGCTKNTGDSGGAGTTDGASAAGTVTVVDNATGPAPAVAGAKPGGKITVYFLADFDHLDPAQNFIAQQQVATRLIYRGLTAFREYADGRRELVGDLATNTGVTTDGGKTWTYTLRDGITYEDGRPITSQDIAYGIARSFSPALPNGAKYIQQWLVNDIKYNATYKGPYDGGAQMPPNVETPDAKTIVFKFAVAHPDMPYAGTLATSTPVPKDKDTKVDYDNRPFASGPYKIAAYERGQRLVFVKNDKWNPTSDPIRHQYPDTIQFVFNPNGALLSERVLADQGEDAAAVLWAAVTPDVLPRVMNDSAARARTVRGPSIYVWYLAINNLRVPDLTVRQALNFGFDRAGFVKLYGADYGDPATTILSPSVAGYSAYNAYDGGAAGDTTKARAMLGGKKVPLVYAYVNTPRQQKFAAFIKANLDAAGFAITLQPQPGDQFITTIAKKDNPYHLYLQGWGADWPSGSTVIPPLFDGRSIQAEGNQNFTYFNDAAVNAHIDSIMAEPDLAKAAPMWGALDRLILEKHAPVVPVFYQKWLGLFGSKVGGAYVSPSYGTTGLDNIFVK
jgi:peptide/nickel transport system substrate-binding protein